jgi:Flp pilus assembly protein TadG
MAVDLPYYFAAQNQLQTATDAAALAGASALPDGEQQAKDAAYDMASRNPVAGKSLQPSDMQYNSTGSSFEVTASSKVPTMMANFLCSFSAKAGAGKKIDDGGVGNGGSDSGSAGSGCSYMSGLRLL